VESVQVRGDSKLVFKLRNFISVLMQKNLYMTGSSGVVTFEVNTRTPLLKLETGAGMVLYYPVCVSMRI
jgi:hypothetical protein